jgi:hypothetical protein
MMPNSRSSWRMVYPHTCTVKRNVMTQDGPHQKEKLTVISEDQKCFIQTRMGQQRGMSYTDRYNYSSHYGMGQAPYGSDLKVNDILYVNADPTIGWKITNIENPNLVGHHLEIDLRGDE